MSEQHNQQRNNDMELFLLALVCLYILSEILFYIETEKDCLWCHKQINEDTRYDRKFCSQACKEAAKKYQQ